LPSVVSFAAILLNCGTLDPDLSCVLICSWLKRTPLPETGITLARLRGMKTTNAPTKCYLAAFHCPELDSALVRRGLCRGMICFAIPELGILFRCRAGGELVDLEFGAMFALLKFVKTKLQDEKIRTVQIHSSNPEFVFAFTGSSRHLKQGSQRMKMLTEYNKELVISMAYLEPVDNKALVSSAEYPSMPVSRSISFNPHDEDLSKTSFKPFQKGIRL